MNNLLVLYAEVMPYNVVAFETFAATYPAYRLHVVCWDESKKITAYQHPKHEAITYYRQSDFSEKDLLALYDLLQPQLILVSGRMDKSYLTLAAYAKKKKCIVVGNSDNQFLGSLKNYISIFFSFYLYKRYFTHMQVPGSLQYRFCRLLGYQKEKIIFPQYTADVSLFEAAYLQTKTKRVYKKILFIARLESVKGIALLLKVHRELYSSQQITTPLVVVGSGSLQQKLNLSYPGITYYPFMSQKEIVTLLDEIQYFCLPSLYEPWGVVLHEAAAAGLPIVTTSVCGAASTFVTPTANGFVIAPNSEKELKEAMLAMHAKSNEEIKKMGEISYQLSKKITPEMWGTSLMQLIEKR
ncbi:glycosyltransferase [Flavobacterium difficile]|uniref:Glycosyltransferase n=1 Tax=Flavobacterium difficile TaxID=2709659 RepID=A0ABX0I1N8_9FLAO|nr:glycosyltransferase [Flavobacterium difficile]NHM01095.1 glycosyltransferase [Flavobacterium difficile]